MMKYPRDRMLLVTCGYYIHYENGKILDISKEPVKPLGFYQKLNTDAFESIFSYHLPDRRKAHLNKYGLATLLTHLLDVCYTSKDHFIN